MRHAQLTRWYTGNVVGDDADSIAAMLLTNTTLHSLGLRGDFIGWRRGCLTLCLANEIGDVGSSALALALQKNTTLHSLDLGGTNVHVAARASDRWCYRKSHSRDWRAQFG